ncbi:MAG: methionine adenosyltransferase [Patescibacteria group bacterium]|nr:methionine adenosyltransferase [Patescibacteria group bacterium]
MFNGYTTYTVESVTSGHPDKICDQISDGILDACLKDDRKSRVAIETLGAHGLLVIGGEVTTKSNFNARKIAKKIYRDIGYKDDIKIITQIVKQSPDIAQGVDTGGAGDQGIMYGYATNETSQFLPKGVVLVHKLTSGLEKLRKKGKVKWLKPDGKAQITITRNKIKTILISCQHSDKVSQEEIKKTLIKELIKPVIGNIDGIEILVNPTGKFVIGGFSGDSGLTGRKIMVDTYGGLIPHGGGCLSGKDPTKVDRSAAYMTRFVAKNLVAAGYAKSCLVSVAYAIGKAEPLMVEALNEKGKRISEVKKYDFRPLAIIERLNLRRPIYFQTASYGHFTKPDLPWEQIV